MLRRFSLDAPLRAWREGDFTPGVYLKEGYIITSRGCPNRCWFCSVPKREGPLRELPIADGWNVLDDNLLACSDVHVKAVFEMLAKQKRRPLFTGGLEAALLKPWHVLEFARLKPKELFFAYDTPNDREPLYEAGKMLVAAGFKRCHPLRAYVLVGYPGDSLKKPKSAFLSVFMRALPRWLCFTETKQGSAIRRGLRLPGPGRVRRLYTQK